MDIDERSVMERLESAAQRLEHAMHLLSERQAAVEGDLKHISATVESGEREAMLTEQLAEARRAIEELKAAAASPVLNPLRKTLPAATTEMLAKHGIGEGQVDVRKLDAALAGLSLEQRIAVKSQLLRAGAIA